MVKLFNVILFLSLTTWTMQSMAFNYLTPHGQREALMANVGIGLPKSEAAVLYNPAGVAGLESNRISAAASLLNVSTYKYESKSNEFLLDDKNEAPSFSQIPGMIAGYQNSSFGNIGYYISTDYQFTFDKTLAYSSTTVVGYSDYHVNLNILNIGGAFAKTISLTKNNQLHLGMTGGLQMLESQTTTLSKYQTSVASSTSYISAFTRTVSKAMNLVSRAGILLENPKYTIGAFAQPRGRKISSSYSKFDYSVSTDGNVHDNSSNNGADLASEATYGLGIGILALNSTKFYIDYSAIDSAKNENDDSDSNRASSTSAGIGVEQTLWSGNRIYAGISQSRIKEKQAATAWLLTTGFEYEISFIHNYLGLYYSRQSQDKAPESNSSNFVMNNFGLVIASRYNF